jgi:hypothetical protein
MYGGNLSRSSYGTIFHSNIVRFSLIFAKAILNRTQIVASPPKESV